MRIMIDCDKLIGRKDLKKVKHKKEKVERETGRKEKKVKNPFS